jgi:guanylate kinase
LIVIVSGPGGVGKGTVVARLLELRPEIRLSRSWTTRPRRTGEPEDAYVFVDRERFMANVAEEGFLEWTGFEGTGHLYGTPALVRGLPAAGDDPAGADDDPAGADDNPAGADDNPAGADDDPAGADDNPAGAADEVIVLEIDLDGARQVKQGHPDAVLILITAPSREVQEARLRSRGDDETSVARRLEVGDRELALGASMADHVVVNDDVDRSAREVAGIIDGRRNDP